MAYQTLEFKITATFENGFKVTQDVKAEDKREAFIIFLSRQIVAEIMEREALKDNYIRAINV